MMFTAENIDKVEEFQSFLQALEQGDREKLQVALEGDRRLAIVSRLNEVSVNDLFRVVDSVKKQLGEEYGRQLQADAIELRR